MKFTITQQDLLNMLKQVSKKQPWAKRHDKVLRLSACAARVFVEANETVAGIEALVLQDGACTLDRTMFTDLVKTYAGRTNLTIEANERFLQIANTRINIQNFSPTASPPAKFQVFRVTDTWVVPKKEST